MSRAGSEHQQAGLVAAAAVIGVGLSGFFDGILLHQILQWHHLLSLVPGERFRDVETQIFADGAFHVLMYLVTAVGLGMLWRRRDRLAEAGWRAVAGGGLIGFGLWNLADVGLFHWVLGIHRIRVNVPDPMVYDLAWIVLLGALPALAGWKLLRGDRSGGHGPAAGAAISLLALGAAPLAALPQGDGRTALVLFAPGISGGEAINAVLAADGRIVWANPHGRTMVVRFGRRSGSSALYRSGAMLVTRSPILAGCAASVA